jgi:hypothetical protein
VCDGWREPGHAQISIQKHDGNVTVVDQVLQVGVEAGERLVLLFEFPIEIFELLIEGMQFLVCRLQFLDQGRYFLAC